MGIFKETEPQRAFRQQIMTQVRILEYDDRQIEIKQIEGLLTNKIAEFERVFEGQESIVQRGLDAKNPQEIDNGQASSSTSTGSRRQQLGKNKGFSPFS